MNEASHKGTVALKNTPTTAIQAAASVENAKNEPKIAEPLASKTTKTHASPNLVNEKPIRENS